MVIVIMICSKGGEGWTRRRPPHGVNEVRGRSRGHVEYVLVSVAAAVQHETAERWPTSTSGTWSESASANISSASSWAASASGAPNGCASGSANRGRCPP